MSTNSLRPSACIVSIAAATLLALASFPTTVVAGSADPTAAVATDLQVRAVKDAWITMKIHTQFLGEDALEGSNIDVDTKSGTVILTGTVPSEAARAKAIAVAKATEGAKTVTDKLQIGPAEKTLDMKQVREAGKTAGRTITDGWVKSKIYAQFITEDALEDSDIDIDISKGAVTLNGTVKSEAGRARAIAIAKATSGVTTVKDALRIGD